MGINKLTMNMQTIKAADLFEIDKVQVFDRLTGNYICTMQTMQKYINKNYTQEEIENIF